MRRHVQLRHVHPVHQKLSKRSLHRAFVLKVNCSSACAQDETHSFLLEASEFHHLHLKHATNSLVSCVGPGPPLEGIRRRGPAGGMRGRCVL